MKNFKSYISENLLVESCINAINESSQPIKLPYTFDIYNEGPKNKDYKITKSNIYKIFFSIDKSEEFNQEDGTTVVKFVDKHEQMIKLPLPADKITYKEYPTKKSTDNWTKIPEVQDYMYAGAWYSNKISEYNYSKYNEDWNTWFRMIKPYMRGKISVTVNEEKPKKENGDKVLVFTVNNDKFNQAREQKIQELKDVNNLKKWADEADSAEKAKIKKNQEDERERKEAEDRWNKWWNSLNDDERLAWSMGYGRGSGTYTGD